MHPVSIPGERHVAYEEELSELAALRAVNSDVLGWILIPDAPISYSLVQKVTMLII